MASAAQRRTRGEPRVAELDPHIHGIVEDLLPTRAVRDFVSGFSGPLAIVIADMLGVPHADRDRFRRWSTTLIQSNPTRGEFRPGLDAAASLRVLLRVSR